jgi:hypothetical protein
LSYTYRRYTGDVDTHGVSPTLGIVISDELRLDLSYWLTYVGVGSDGTQRDSRIVHAASLSAGRTFLPWLSLRAGYSHGAEAERWPAAFQILDLVSDSAFLGAELSPTSQMRVYPLYNLTLRGPRGGDRIPIHTLELGAAFRW